MQIRCTFCQTMYAISHEETLAALEHMEEEHQTYYEAHCPRCRRATRVERFKLEASYPTWREDLKQMAKQAGTKPAPIPASPAPKVEIPAVTAKKHSHRPAGVAARHRGVSGGCALVNSCPLIFPNPTTPVSRRSPKCRRHDDRRHTDSTHA